MRQLRESMKQYGDFDDYAAYQVWQDFNRQEDRANLEANQQGVLVMRKGSREA